MCDGASAQVVGKQGADLTSQGEGALYLSQATLQPAKTTGMSLGLLPVSSAPAQLAGRLKYFQANWNLITDDPWVLKTIMGYKIEFHSVPHQVTWPRTLMPKAQQESVQVEVDKMILQGAIHPVTSNTEGGFVSSIFLVDKKDGGHRPVINLKNLNSFVDFQHFKMEGIHMLRDLLKKGDFMVKLDLKDAYFTVPVWIGHQKYLRFLWKETLWEFACLIFGLASAPRTFTKIMKPVVATLQWTEHRRPVESVRAVSPHKLPGTAGRVFCKKMLCKRQDQHSHSAFHGQCDSSYLHQQDGGNKIPCPSLFLSRPLQWCLQRQITVSASHIPGILKVNADRESRSHLDSSDWKLCPAVFQALQNRWGPLDIDLFASRLTNQLPRFVSWKPDPLSEAVDAFSLQWNKVKGYAFPPFCLLGRCLSQVLRQQVPAASPCSTNVENPTLVSSFIGPSYIPSSPSPPNHQSVNSGRNDSPTNPPPAGRMAYLSQQYEEGGFSVQARDLLSAAWRRNTSDQYTSAWRKWTSWCAERKVNPISASLSDIINFLAGEYQQGK